MLNKQSTFLNKLRPKTGVDPKTAMLKQIEIDEEKIFKKINETIVMCIDPETRLPFTVNMGL